MVDSEEVGIHRVTVGAALLQATGHTTSVSASDVVLVRGSVHGEIRLESKESTMVLHDVMEDITWCYDSASKTLLIGSHTGAMAYVVDLRQMRVVHRVALRRADEQHMLKLAFIPTPNRSRVLLLSEERMVGFTWEGAVFFNRELRATDELVDVSDAWIGFRGIEHDELVYFIFPTPPMGRDVLDHLALALGREQSTGTAKTHRQGTLPSGLPEAEYREVAYLEFGWTSTDDAAGQAPSNALGIALNDIAAVFVRTSSGVFPTYPARASLLPTLTGWIYEVMRLMHDTSEARRGTLYVGASSLYRVVVTVRDQNYYLRFLRKYIPTDLDLLPPAVMAAGRFEAALFHVCERAQRLIEVAGIETAETRAFTSAFLRLREQMGVV